MKYLRSLILLLICLCAKTIGWAQAEIASDYSNESTRKQNWYLDSLITTNATPVTWCSIVVPQNKIVEVTIDFQVRKSDFSSCYGGTVSLAFIRGTGNISKQGTLISSITGGIAGIKPIIDLQANLITQSVDVVVTGVLLTTLIWNGHYELMGNK